MIILNIFYAEIKIIIITHWLSNTQFFINNFKKFIDVKTITYLKKMQKYMSRLPIAAPHRRELILKAATKKHLSRVREHLFYKISQNA